MTGISAESTIWVAGETTGKDETGASVAVPTPFYVSTATTAPTAAGDGNGSNIFITSDDSLYLWNGSAWVGPYTT